MLDTLFNNFTYLKTVSSDVSYVGVWFISENSKPLEIEDKLSNTFVFN